MFNKLKKMLGGAPAAESAGAVDGHSTDEILSLLRARMRETGGLNLPDGLVPAPVAAKLHSAMRDGKLSALPADLLDPATANKMLAFLLANNAVNPKSNR